jgi:L-threonylcarbamoyladenylate synthase
MAEILSTAPSAIARAIAHLREGRLVAFGTETVYGLGADATRPAAVAAIFAAKDRPRFNPLICHYATAEDAFAHVAPNALARALAAVFWPGPLTLVLRRLPDCPVALLTGAGLDTLAVRVPAGDVAGRLIAGLGAPIAAPSANRSGRVSPTIAAHVLEGLGDRIAAVIDSGPCMVGVESTVLDLSGPRPTLLRPGGATREAIEAVIGPIARAEATAALRGPGMLASHYAPGLPVRLNATSAGAEEALLAFGSAPPDAALTFNLSPAGDTTEAASRLFEGLRWLDREGAALGLRGIAVMAVPDGGLGLAINDRLARAAAPRT